MPREQFWGSSPTGFNEQSELQINRGDKLVVFTDGLVEACNAYEEPFGEDNVVRSARENPGASAKDLMVLLTQAASQHCGGRFQDDASVIVLKAVEP
jgi:serine phosphatase RsbU (regulator of sigma subunit)